MKCLLNKSMINRRGSFALEASIIFPVVLILTTFFMWQITAIRSETIYKSFLLSEAEKAPLFGVLYQFSDDILKEYYLESIDDDISEFVFAQVYKIIFKKQFENSYRNYIADNPSYKSIIKNHRFFIENDICDNIVHMTSVYDINTPFGTVRKKFVFPVVFWSKSSVFQSESKDVENIWQKNNFERGRILRTLFGGNLPFGYPVLSGFRNNTALIIRSMDLNADSRQNTDLVYAKLKDDVIKIREFEGNDIPWGKDEILILKNDITQRQIIFVFPEDIDYEKYDKVFQMLKNFGKENRVYIDIRFYQSSKSTT